MDKQIKNNRVRVLPEAVANQIAAGEVVERPASVLKELVENSLDAGSTRIGVEVQGGGRRLIRVVDNGHGMEPDDMLLALERHATSKVVRAEDLVSVSTLGFRGEALPSVAAVSKLLMRSRTAQNEVGSELKVVGGSIREVKETGCPVGTLIEVKDLFHNTPARRKFLKSATTENSHLTQTMFRLALANPKVAFRFKSGSRQVFDLPATDDLKGRVAALLGRDTAARMVPLYEESGPLFITGLAGLPSLSRTGYDQVYTFVNGRYVRDKVLIHAVGQAYLGLFAERRRPVMVVHVRLDPALVDVNVHPAKTEVRFREANLVHDAFVQGIRRGLAQSQEKEPAGPATTARTFSRPYQPETAPVNPLPRVAEPGLPEPEQGRKSWLKDDFSSGINYRPGRTEQLNTISTPALDSFASTAPESSVEPGKTPGFKPSPLFEPAGDVTVLGQLHNLYIVCAWPKGLLIIDQHAAHERLAYDRMRRGLEQGHCPRQGLLSPVTMELTPVEADWAARQAEDWSRLGLVLEPFGGLTWAITAIPQFLMGKDPAPVVRDLLAELAQSGVSASTPEFAEVSLRSLACRSAIKQGQHLSHAELNDLAAKVASLPPPVTCPHGRPVMLAVSAYELGRLFKRSETKEDD